MRHLIAIAVLTVAAPACLVDEAPHQQSRESHVSATCAALGGTFAGVVFTDEQGSYAVDLANRATGAELQEIDGVGPSIADRIIAGRPYPDLAALDAVPYVGARVLAGFRAHGAADIVVDWANHASADELTAVCRVGARTAAAIEGARPFASLDDLAALPEVSDYTLRHLLGDDGYRCSTKGAVADAWCGIDGVQCWCSDELADGFVLDEDAATGYAEEFAGVFYADNADYVWEEHCEAAYDHGLPYDQADVQAFCDRYVTEVYFIAVINSALGLAGTVYADEDAARATIAALAESVFFAGIDGWMEEFQVELIRYLGLP